MTQWVPCVSKSLYVRLQRKQVRRRERVKKSAALTQSSDSKNQVKFTFDITEKKNLTSNDDDDDDDGSFLTHENAIEPMTTARQCRRVYAKLSLSLSLGKTQIQSTRYCLTHWRKKANILITKTCFVEYIQSRRLVKQTSKHSTCYFLWRKKRKKRNE